MGVPEAMNERQLTSEEVLAAYDRLVPLYGHVPPLILWRAWELAAYRDLSLAEPALDVGCGDGRFFRVAFPSTRDVVGIDVEPGVLSYAQSSGTYRDLILASSDRLPLQAATFGSVFANCAVEHMDDPCRVFREVNRVLRPGGTFLFSVVTDCFVSWKPVAKLMSVCGAEEAGRLVQQRHETYHHLVSALPIPEWCDQLSRSGFRMVGTVPIVSGAAGQSSLLLDQLWHVEHDGSEFGTKMLTWIQLVPGSSSGLRQIFAGLLELSQGSTEHAGVVLFARKD